MKRQPDLILHGAELNKPAIYAWKRGEEWLYIGITEVGIIRRLQGHHVVGNIHQFKDEDRIVVWHVNLTRNDLIALERKLILKHKPKYNKQSDKGATIAVRFSAKDKLMLTRAALVNDQTLSEWIRGLALAAAGKESKRRGW